MSEPGLPPEWEDRLRQTAADFAYPVTPDIAGQVRQRLRVARPARRPVRRLIVIVGVLVLMLLAVPSVRANLVRWLRIGAVEIVPQTPTALPLMPRTVTVQPTPSPASDLLRMVGTTTLAAASERLGRSVPLPSYPADLGPPDRVFVQNLGGPAIVLAWLVPGSSTEVDLSLHILRSDMLARKFIDQTSVLSTTTVAGEPAVWVGGPHLLQLYDAAGDPTLDAGRLVGANTLIWTHPVGFTFRLETSQNLPEAIRIAESVRVEP